MGFEKNRGYFGIGIDNPKTMENVGMLNRSAMLLGASFTFTIDNKYEPKATDTMKSWRHIPHFYFNCDPMFPFDIKPAAPYDCKIVGVEMTQDSISLEQYIHPQRAMYVLGNESRGLDEYTLTCCDEVIQIPCGSLNVAVAGSIVMYDRLLKQGISRLQPPYLKQGSHK